LGFGEDFDSRLAHLVIRLTREPKFLGWQVLAVMLAEVNCTIGGSFAEELTEALSPYAGKIVVIGVAPAAVFGPVDFYLARLAVGQKDWAEASRLLQSALRLAETSRLVGWLPRLTKLAEEIKNNVGEAVRSQ
jgi:hypothetical protein